MDLSSVIRNAEEVLRVLKQYNHEENYKQLEDLIAQLDDPRRRRQALISIEDMCHGRRLGDLDTGSFSIDKWWDLLENLRRSVQRQLDQLK